jgi:hypothetical protein
MISEFSRIDRGAPAPQRKRARAAHAAATTETGFILALSALTLLCSLSLFAH